MAASLPIPSRPRRFRKSILALSSALGGLALLPGAHAQSQSEIRLPTRSDVKGTQVSPGIGSAGPSISNRNNTLTVTLKVRLSPTLSVAP